MEHFGFFMTMIGVLGFTLLTGVLASEIDHTKRMDEMQRGCIASAYQATNSGFDLEENLKFCTTLK